MIKTLSTYVALLLTFACWGNVLTAQDDTTKLLLNVPEGANFLVSVQAKTIREKASAETQANVKALVAQANSWAIVSPWDPIQIVIGAELDIQHMEPSWEMATVSFAKQPDFDQIAKQQDAVVDELSGRSVLWLPNVSVIRTGANELTFANQRNRQSITRWLQKTEAKKSPTLSPFLTEFAATEMTTAEIGIAIDMKNVFRSEEIKAVVQRNPLLAKLNTNPTNILASIRGVTVACHLTGDQDSSVSIVFGESVEPLESIARPLVYRALVSSGAMLDEFEQWKVTAAGNKFTLSGKLTPTGLRRILSLSSIGTVAASAHAAPESTPDANPAVDSDSAGKGQSDTLAAAEDTTKIRRATQRYFNQITSNLDNLRGKGGLQGGGEIKVEQNGLWINNYAKQIDNQSTRNVDPQMIEYGKTVSDGFKQIVEQVYTSEQKRQIKDATGTPIVGRTQVSAVPWQRIGVGGQFQYRYAPMVRQNLNIGAAMQERNANQMIQNAEINNAARDIMKNLDAATDSIRAEMSQKYGVKF